MAFKPSTKAAAKVNNDRADNTALTELRKGDATTEEPALVRMWSAAANVTIEDFLEEKISGDTAAKQVAGILAIIGLGWHEVADIRRRLYDLANDGPRLPSYAIRGRDGKAYFREY